MIIPATPIPIQQPCVFHAPVSKIIIITIITYNNHTILVGGWATPLKNMKVKWDDDINPILMGK